MKRYQSFIVKIVAIALVISGGWCIWRATRVVPELGAEVSEPVNQAEGITLDIMGQQSSVRKGMVIRWEVHAESSQVYTFGGDEESFVYLERCVDGKWYRLEKDPETPTTHRDKICVGGGENTGMYANFVQKYDGYGNHLEDGQYRLTLEMKDSDGNTCYLAAEFSVN